MSLISKSSKAGLMGEEIRAASRRRRAERKLAQQRAVAGGAWTRCLYKVPGKERYCAQHRSKHSTKFCGTHMGETVEKGRRVPCPVDPNHTVFEHQLASHAKICNLAILQAKMEAQPYYSKGINSGPPLPEEEGEEKEDDQAEGRGAAPDAAFDEAFLLDLVSRVAAAHRDLVGEIPMEVLDHVPEVLPLHRTRTEDGTGFRKGRHVLQHASLVGHLVKRGLAGPVDNDNDENNVNSSGTATNGAAVSGPRVLHVEMGAGKGALGQSIAAAFPGADITMVERSSVRRKAENRLDGVSARARIDIRDLNMAGLPSLAPCGEGAPSSDGGGGGGNPVVAVAKHLCGVATDLALRAMLTLSPTESTPPSGERSTSAGGGGGGGGETAAATSLPMVGGVAVATCCHHVCNWRDYAGREFLSRQGFTARDFDAMRRISAWISLEPDAGTRKNNRYPEDKHPTSAAPALPSPPSFSSKILASPAPPTIAEEDILSEVTASPAAGGAGAGGAGVAGADRACSTASSTAAITAAPKFREISQKTGGIISYRPEGSGAADLSVHAHAHQGTEASTGDKERQARGGGQQPGPGRRGKRGPLSPGAASPSSSSASQPVQSTPRLTADSLQASAPQFPTAEVVVARPPSDQAAAEEAVDDDDDDDKDEEGGHHKRGHAPHLIQPASAAAAAAHAPTTGVPAAVVAARVPKALLALAGLTPAEKARAARECKRLMDRGRRAFIEERLGLASEVVHFVGREITPENALLLGFQKEGHLSD